MSHGEECTTITKSEISRIIIYKQKVVDGRKKQKNDIFITGVSLCFLHSLQNPVNLKGFSVIRKNKHLKLTTFFQTKIRSTILLKMTLS